MGFNLEAGNNHNEIMFLRKHNEKKHLIKRKPVSLEAVLQNKLLFPIPLTSEWHRKND